MLKREVAVLNARSLTALAHGSRSKLRLFLPERISCAAERTKLRLEHTSEVIGYHVAKLYRRMLNHVCFIGITGSCGKTTTNELIGAILSSRHKGRTSHQLYNGPYHIAKTILTVLPWHHFCSHEMGSPEPGVMARSVRVFRPRIGVVTHIADDHRKSFRTLEATAADKGKLIEALPSDGAAILNADDPRVLAMRERTTARVITYGLNACADVRGESISCAWPQRLSLMAVCGSVRVHVRTRLLGEHWSYAILAALATGVALGIPLKEGARAIETVEPVDGRMSPAFSSDGVLFVQDDWKAPLWTISGSLQFVRSARARRKIVVIGTISDYSGKASRTYPAVARAASEFADRVIFVGPLAHCALKARTSKRDERVLAFSTLHELKPFLDEYLAPDDLVLLKGSRHTDHLERLVLARGNAISCWRVGCRRGTHCHDCGLRHSSFLPAATK
jgi:UDP-N-acetylmuramyl pentapeptide synthase